MSDELTLVERERPRPSRCPQSKDAMLDTVSYFAIGFVFVGLVFSAVGFLYPRGVKHDPNASAAENEKKEIEYMQMTKALNAIIVAGHMAHMNRRYARMMYGMILTGLGGLILSAIFTTTVVCRDCHDDDYVGDAREPVTSRRPTSQASGPTTNNTSGNVNYGAVPDTVSSAAK